jgi:signal transduction histidine kinase/DNA-binding response OmpR family regulator
MRCVMICMDISPILQEVLGNNWEYCRADTTDELLAIAHSGPIDLACWKAGDYDKMMPELRGAWIHNRTLCNAANISFGRNRRYEAEMLALGHEDFILLPTEGDVLRARIQNALKRKALVRNAREELWTTFAYRHTLLDQALFIFEIDVDTGRAVEMRASPEAEKRFYPFQDLTSDPNTIVYFHPEDRLLILDTFSASGIRRMLEQGITEREFEYRLQDKSGIWRWVKSRIRFEKDIFGGQRCFAYTNAIRPKAQDKEICRKAFDGSLLALLTVDLEQDACRRIFPETGGFEISGSYNANYRKLFKRLLDGEEYLRACEDFNPEMLEKQVKPDARIRHTYSGHLPGQTALRHFWTEAFCSGDKSGLIALIIWDVTEVFQDVQGEEKGIMEKLHGMENDKAGKIATLSRMSHNLRTPLNAAIGMAQIAQKKNEDPDVRECLNKILSSNHYLLKMLDDIMSVEKRESDPLELKYETYSLKRFLRGIDMVIRPKMDEKQIAFSYEITSSAESIETDVSRFNQVFFNLFSNAIQFTASGGKVLFQIAQYTRQKTEWLHFMIQDNGIGMSEVFLPHACDPYTQENPTHRPAQGVGMGLAVAKQTISQMGGTLRIGSVQGEGTCVEVEFPLISGKAISPEHCLPADTAALRGKRVLLAEDDKLNLDIMAYFMQSAEMTVDFAANGEEAVQKFLQEPANTYAAILMDLYMPVVDGIGAAQKIRTSEKSDAKEVPIVAITADAFEEKRRKTKEAGMNEHLTKPIDAETLYRTLLKLIH